MTREMFVNENGRRLAVFDYEVTVLLDERQTAGAYAMVEQEVPAGGGLPFLHTYPVQTTFYVLAGRFAFYRMDEMGKKQTLTLEAQAMIHVPKGVACGFQNIGRDVGTLLTTFEPAGKMEAMFADLDQLVGPDTAERPQGAFNVNELIRIFQRHRLRIFETPLG